MALYFFFPGKACISNHFFMVNFVRRIKYKIRFVKNNIRGNLQKVKYFVIVMSTLQILTFLIVVVLLILYIVES